MIKEFIESLKLKDIVFFVLFIVLFYMVLKKNKKEGFGGQISDANLQAIKNLGDFASQLITPDNVLDLSAVNFKVKSLEVKNNCTIDRKITVKGGGDFNADGDASARYYFEDEEKKGKLRVGAVWGIPGIYAEQGKVIIGSKLNEVHFNNSTSKINNTEINIGNKKVLKADDVVRLQANGHHDNSYIEICGHPANGKMCQTYNVSAKKESDPSSYFIIKS
jgi:hypothetical protein